MKLSVDKEDDKYLPPSTCIFCHGSSYKDNAAQQPGGDGGQALHGGGHRVDDVEHVGQHKEEGHQQPHPAGNNRRGDQEADPGNLNI